jgi:uncharacterized protein YjbI with pentapeptide repeats
MNVIHQGPILWHTCTPNQKGWGMNEEKKLREISSEDLVRVVQDHQKWVESNFTEGKRANLSNTDLLKVDIVRLLSQQTAPRNEYGEEPPLITLNLSEADFSGASLRGAGLSKTIFREANFTGANLQGAKLEAADFQEADLKRANLTGADLKGANLREANLQDAVLQGAELEEANVERAIFKDADLMDAKLKGVLGLKGEQLGGTITTGAEFPEEISQFKTQVSEASRMARNIFLGLISGCVYCWMTIGTTTDFLMITKSFKPKLPIINTEITIGDFFIVAPFVLLCVFFYFHFYLERIWEGLAGLPAIYPDGRRLDQVEYPWLLNGLVRGQFRRLKDERPVTSYLQNLLSTFLGWWIVPITILLFWIRYLRGQFWPGIVIQILLLTAAISAAIIFQRLSIVILRGVKRKYFRWRTFLSSSLFYKYFAIALLIGFMFSWFSYSAIEGTRENFIHRVLMPPLDLAGEDLQQIDFSKININWANMQATNLEGANLSLLWLEGTDFTSANLHKTTFERSHLREVEFQAANAENAIFRETLFEVIRTERVGPKQNAFQLFSVNFERANLKQAIFQGAILPNARLKGADLRGANLREVNLQGADLEKALIEQADLWGAVLEEAFIEQANLEQANLEQANLRWADFWRATLQKANLMSADCWGVCLMEANLQKANLQLANLASADLRGADLRGADLQGANLARAIFDSNTKVNFDQLIEVDTLRDAIGLSVDMRLRLSQKKPELF